MNYHRASTDWLSACTMGISFHWTAQSLPCGRTPRPFHDAVAAFRLPEFLRAVEESRADYVIFTLTHALQMLPCPHPLVDAILPGRTTERDLLGEIARGLAALGKPLIVYYNHSCNGNDDPAWNQAVGYHDFPKPRFADNLLGIVRWLGERYGNLIRAWWFDSAYSLDPRGPHNSVSTDLHGVQFPWEQLTVAAKAGNPDRLVTYNAGVAQTFLYTVHQDYWSGELVDLTAPPTGRYLTNGLQWHGWTCLDDRNWVYVRANGEVLPPLYTDAELLAFLSQCRQHGAPMSFNVVIFQDGTMAEASVAQLRRIRDRLDQDVDMR